MAYKMTPGSREIDSEGTFRTAFNYGTPKPSRQNYSPSESDKASYKKYKAAGGKGDIYQAYRVSFKSPKESKKALSSTGTAQFEGVASRQS